MAGGAQISAVFFAEFASYVPSRHYDPASRAFVITDFYSRLTSITQQSALPVLTITAPSIEALVGRAAHVPLTDEG